MIGEVPQYAVAVKRVVTAFVALCILVVMGCQNSGRAGHEHVVTLTFSADRVAVIGDSYTTGGAEGGLGDKSWPAQAWQLLARQGVATAADVGAEGGAGYGTRGDHGSLFEDLTAATVKPDDRLVVFFGSRNDQPVNLTQLSILAYGTFQLARRIAPTARFIVIGPPWPTADPPAAVLGIRDVLEYQSGIADATFVDPLSEGWLVGMPELIGADGIHPTDAGHAYLAAKIAPLIGAHLPRGT